MKYILPLVLLSCSSLAIAQQEEKKEFKAILIETEEGAHAAMQADRMLKGKRMRWREATEEKLSAEQRASLQSKRMTLHLGLDETQEKKVSKINTKHHQKMQQIKDLEDGFEKTSARLDAQIEHQRELQKILSAEQFAKFKEMHEDRGNDHGIENTMNRVRHMRFKGNGSDQEMEFIIEGDADRDGSHFIFKKDNPEEIIAEQGVREIRVERLKEGRRAILLERMHDRNGHAPKVAVWAAQADDKPLMIVDGKELGSDAKLEDINPSTIKSVEVLKGDKATETYGDKGKNGVILITTKTE